jgi:hypothetical protein
VGGQHLVAFRELLQPLLFDGQQEGQYDDVAVSD